MKLHLGSGDVRLKGWLNVDLDERADLRLDLREALPFDDESIEYVFNEHFIEHIHREEALALLKECHRVLKKNGVLRLSTPDLKYLAVSYLSRNIDEWSGLWRPINPCFLMNEGMRSWGHEFLYDAEELIRILLEAGFLSVKFVRWRESAIDDLVGLETRPFHNELIVEVSKSYPVDDSQEVIAELNENEPWEKIVRNTMLSQVKHLEQAISDQATHIHNLSADWDARGQHIINLEQCIADWEARGQHIIKLEQALADQDNNIRKIEADWEARGQHIIKLEQALADQDNNIRKIAADWEARGQHIINLEQTMADQDTHARKVEAELTKFRLSWYGRLKTVGQKIKRSLKWS